MLVPFTTGAQAGAPVRTQVVIGREAFLSLRDEWNVLAERCGDPVFLHHAFLQLWVEHFGLWSELRVAIARDDAGRLVAALPLLRRRLRLYGISSWMLCSPTNDHNGRFDLLALDPGKAAPALVAALADLADWDVLRMTQVPEGGRAFALAEAARGAGFGVGTTPGQRSPYLSLPASTGALEASLSRNLRQNLRRRRKRLGERGAVSLEQITGPGPGLLPALKEAFELEAAGWKGRGCTAILQDPKTHGFYSGLALWAADRGRLSLSFLRLGERAVAFDLGIVGAGRYLSFKHGYAEDLRECSPGQALTWELARACVDQRLEELDLMGECDTAKAQWTQAVRAHHFLFIFAPTAKGRLLRTAKFRVAPVVKRALGR